MNPDDHLTSDHLPVSSRRKQGRAQSIKTYVISDSSIQLPLLTDVSFATQEALFIRKLRQCSVVYDFMDSSYVREKEIKLAALEELVAYIADENTITQLSEHIYFEIIEMVSSNIFRDLSPAENVEIDPEYDLLVEEASWPHLKLVYDFFLHFINSPNVNIAIIRRVIDRKFISQLLELFKAEDPRERKYVKNVLFCIYLKLFEQRAFIRKQINYTFLKYVYECWQFYGIAELLEILSMAINGFNVPLREEHKTFFIKVLLPLHKPSNLILYHNFLVDCIRAFIKKEEYLAGDVIFCLLKIWPKQSSQKEVLFLRELESLLDVLTAKVFSLVQVPLMKQIAKCMSSMNFMVAKTALELWGKNDFLRLVNNNLDSNIAIVFNELYHSSKEHWSDRICDLSTKLLQKFQESNATLVGDLIASFKAKQRNEQRRQKGLSAEEDRLN